MRASPTNRSFRQYTDGHRVKARRKSRRGETFTRISLLFKELHPIRDEVQEGETFTHIQLYIKGLAPKGEEVKAKKGNHLTRAREREERKKTRENLKGSPLL